MKTLDAILFDMDGVLIDAKQRHKEAFLTALKNQ
jgi:beta-phosphoglucomutase-like phosphatase (HAD superfamily)